MTKPSSFITAVSKRTLAGCESCEPYIKADEFQLISGFGGLSVTDSYGRRENPWPIPGSSRIPIRYESYCKQRYNDWSWKICGLDVFTAFRSEYFAKSEVAIKLNDIEISYSKSGTASRDSSKVEISEASLGINRIHVMLENYDSPEGKYCEGLSYKVPKYELWSCKEISTLDNSAGGDEITVLLYHNRGSKGSCAYIDTFGVLEELKLASCGSKGDLGKFRVFKGAQGDYNKFVLRPQGAVARGLNVCVNDSGQTQDCGVGSNIAELSFPSSSLSTGVIVLGGREFIRVEEVSCGATLDKF